MNEEKQKTYLISSYEKNKRLAPYTEKDEEWHVLQFLCNNTDAPNLLIKAWYIDPRKKEELHFSFSLKSGFSPPRCVGIARSFILGEFTVYCNPSEELGKNGLELLSRLQENGAELDKTLIVALQQKKRTATAIRLFFYLHTTFYQLLSTN